MKITYSLFTSQKIRIFVFPRKRMRLFDERYLRLIEANQFSELPAPVYLRGFLREFAKALRLEPGLVVDSYMKQAEEIRGRR